MSDEASPVPPPFPDRGIQVPDGLVLVSTPIGNLSDLTARAAACLAQADLVLCEDTRVTAKLFSAWQISSRLMALHDHNERQKIPTLLDLLRQGKRIALVCDAGTPLLSDPGFQLVRAAIAAGLPVTAAPGPTAMMMALTLSGLPPHPFLFLAFPPARHSARRATFGQLRAAEQAGLSATMIWHEAPHRLVDMLEDLKAVFGGDREAAVARELTKRFEDVQRGTVAALAEHYRAVPARGEITVMIAPGVQSAVAPEEVDHHLSEALRTLSVKDAASLVAGLVDLPRKVVYARALALSAVPERTADDEITS
ncbi:16S rRNA (cytidine(1402)-2'-O)-methyltransferase [Lichenicoccus sp.]|uniref:16S rRNA (cytidine(1402)-2'-O)-methyltransferase n=1 Tax=Lichenicoccus sp. TaxID=2781899 RepID=UPI003D133B3F